MTAVRMSESKIKPDRTLDQRGLLCPMPVINANEAINGLSSGKILEVVCTDPGSKPDFDAWARSRAHEMVSVVEEDGPPKIFKFFIRKGA